MTDTVDPATRSRIMRAVRSRDTKPEMALRRELHRIGVRGYRVNAYLRPTYQYRTGDVVFHGKRVVVYVDGCFWHACPAHYSPSDQARWRAKIDDNTIRDMITRKRIREDGWTVVQFWEHDIKLNAALCAEEVKRVLGRTT